MTTFLLTFVQLRLYLTFYSTRSPKLTLTVDLRTKQARNDRSAPRQRVWTCWKLLEGYLVYCSSVTKHLIKHSLCITNTNIQGAVVNAYRLSDNGSTGWRRESTEKSSDNHRIIEL